MSLKWLPYFILLSCWQHLEIVTVRWHMVVVLCLLCHPHTNGQTTWTLKTTANKELSVVSQQTVKLYIKLSRLSHITTTHKVFSVQAPFNLAVFYNGKRITLFSFGYTLLAPICVRWMLWCFQSLNTYICSVGLSKTLTCSCKHLDGRKKKVGLLLNPNRNYSQT